MRLLLPILLLGCPYETKDDSDDLVFGGGASSDSPNATTTSSGEPPSIAEGFAEFVYSDDYNEEVLQLNIQFEEPIDGFLSGSISFLIEGAFVEEWDGSNLMAFDFGDGEGEISPNTEGMFIQYSQEIIIVSEIYDLTVTTTNVEGDESESYTYTAEPDE